jgi:hypothetical protein
VCVRECAVIEGGLGLRVFRFRGLGLGLRFEGPGVKVTGYGFEVRGLGFRD